MEVFHMRKLASVSVAFIVAAGVLTASPAHAVSISNGVACAKSGITKTVSGRKYKCTKNPLSTSEKLSWLSNDCIIAANNYLKAKIDATAISTKYAAQIPVIDLGITNENTNKAEIQIKLDESNLRLTAAKAKLAAAISVADKKVLTTAVGSWTSAVRAYTSKVNTIMSNTRKLEAAKLIATNQPAQLAASIADSKSTAQLICTKGL